ncbi:MAG: hypothetical protein K2K53_09510, partial [Oscillospiraceae bacterium]|nr:hypothetical protein [Oscillospiraceae bacterium]
MWDSVKKRERIRRFFIFALYNGGNFLYNRKIEITDLIGAAAPRKDGNAMLQFDEYRVKLNNLKP